TMLSTLKNNPNIYDSLEGKSSYLQKGLNEIFNEANIDVQINRVGSMLSIFFTNSKVSNWDTAATTNINLYAAFFHEMLQRGVYLPPSAYETYFVSDALSYEDIDQVINAAKSSIQNIDKSLSS